MIYSTIFLSNGKLFREVKAADAAPVISGFLAIWLDGKVFYLNKRHIIQFAIKDQELLHESEEGITGIKTRYGM